MAEFHEIGSSQFTDVTPTGQEKIQISATQRATLNKIAELALGQKLAGFSSLPPSEASPINANDTLMKAIQKLVYSMADGQTYTFSMYDATSGVTTFGIIMGITDDEYGVVGLVFDGSHLLFVDDSSGITIAQVMQKNDSELLAWIEDNNMNTLPFGIPSGQAPGFSELPVNSRLKFVDNKGTIKGVLQMLTASVCQGRLRIVVGNPSTGASGRPEIAFIVNIVQGTNAEIQGTNGLQVFHFTTDFLRMIPSSSIGMAWPTLQTLTDEAIIKKLNSTASGDWGGLGLKLPWTAGGSIKDILMTGWTKMLKTPVTENWPIQVNDSLLVAIQKLSSGLLSNGLLKIVTDGYCRLAFIVFDYNNGIGSHLYLDVETQELNWGFESVTDTGIQNKTDSELLDLLGQSGKTVTLGIAMHRLTYLTNTGNNPSLDGSVSAWYNGTNLTPTVTVYGGNFTKEKPTASLVVPYNVNPNWTTYGTGITLHKHQNYDDVAPTSGYKVYTLFCQIVESVKHIFINVAPYN